MKRITLKIVVATVIVMAASGLCANASPVDTNTAKVVAKNYLQKHDPSVKTTGIFRVSDVARANGLSNLYIVERTDRAGFVVISADDCVQPVLAYSTSSPADIKIPESTMDWFRGYDGEIGYCVSNNIQATEEVRAQWDQLVGNQAQTPTPFSEDAILDVPVSTQSNNNAVVGPLLTTTWDQAPIYNNLCPYDNTYNERTVVGCVATAMAQIMKYWNYPVHGIGSNSYSCSNTYSNYGTLSANFSSATYDWANMPNSLNASSTSAQINAVATLSYHCGVSVNMMYGVSSQGGSAAYTNGDYYSTSEYALKTYFGYKTTLESAYRSYYSDAQWNAIIRSEIDANRPILYRGSGTGGGHAFVCDGYDNDGKFHFNWGWSGSYDGFFASNNLAPAGGGIGSNQSNTFNDGQAVVIGIEPNNNSLVVRPEAMTASPIGGTQTLTIRPAVSDTNSWHASTIHQWISLSANTGAGSGTVANITVTVQPNLSGYNRRGEITVIHHNDTVIVPVLQGYGTNCQSGQYGNNDRNYIKIFDTNNTMVFRPEMYGHFNPGDTVKSFFFSTYYHSQYPSYSDSIFTLKIYENPTVTSLLDQGYWDTVPNVMGTMVYSQTYYQPTQGDQIVPLTTPYVVNGNPFWVTLTSEGQSLVRFYADPIGDSILYANYPLLDSANGRYLECRNNKIHKAYMADWAIDRNYVYQFNTYYVFGINVSVNIPVVITARPDTANHGYVLGGGAYNVGDTVTLQAFALPGYSFVSWSDSVATPTRTFVIQPNTYYPDFVAVYNARTSYTLSVTTATPQLGTTTGSGRYYAGDTVSAIAIPIDSTRYFVRWNDNNTSNPRRFAISSNTQLVATFATYAAGGMIVHDTIHDTTYINVPVHDTTYINVAVHDTIHDTAYVNLPQHNFNISSANNAQGVTVGSGTYPQGLRIGIAAVPAEGYRFSHWSDNSTDNPRHFTVSGDVTLTAHFTASSQGVPTLDKSVAIDIYPNPTTGFITLSQFAEKVEVLDTWGRLVAVAENVINMDLSDLADGTYTLRISTQGTVVLKKVVKR